MSYKNLHELVLFSSGSRKYFLSLPVELQLLLCEQSEYIHSAFDLHSHADLTEKHQRAVVLSESLFSGRFRAPKS